VRPERKRGEARFLFRIDVARCHREGRVRVMYIGGGILVIILIVLVVILLMRR
jgi:hypothetical protein